MKVNVEKLENSQVKLVITVESEKFEEGMNKAFFKNAKYFSVPGFRKGKAPRARVEKFYGEHILYEDAFNEVAPEIYDEAIKENNPRWDRQLPSLSNIKSFSKFKEKYFNIINSLSYIYLFFSYGLRILFFFIISILYFLV